MLLTTVDSINKLPGKVNNFFLPGTFESGTRVGVPRGNMVPVVPIGVYVDGKYAIPFEKLDEDANVTGTEFKLYMGPCLHFGKKRPDRHRV